MIVQTSIRRACILHRLGDKFSATGGDRGQLLRILTMPVERTLILTRRLLTTASELFARQT